MTLYFATGNTFKFQEVREIIKGVQQLDVDLDEVQSLDSEVVIKHKLQQAQSLYPGKRLAVEDISIEFPALNGLPGPLVKWFLESLKDKGLYELVSHYDDHSAHARASVGLLDQKGKITFFTGKVSGQVVAPRVGFGRGFGFDAIFLPDGHDKTFSEMTISEKNAMSHRHQAWSKLAEFLVSSA